MNRLTPDMMREIGRHLRADNRARLARTSRALRATVAPNLAQRARRLQALAQKHLDALASKITKALYLVAGTIDKQDEVHPNAFMYADELGAMPHWFKDVRLSPSVSLRFTFTWATQVKVVATFQNIGQEWFQIYLVPRSGKIRINPKARPAHHPGQPAGFPWCTPQCCKPSSSIT